MKLLTILGSTGSIGCSTLDVVRHNPDNFRVVALVAGKNVTRMVEQCLEFSPRYAVMDDETSANRLKATLKEHGSRTEVLSGQQAACDMAALDEVDQVMAAIVGAAGLLPTLAAIRAGKTILLANKESLVTCGRLFMDAVKRSKAQLLPVDSEHNAIFQSMPQPIQHNLGYADLEQNGVMSVLLTGSGGPFRETPLRDLVHMTPDQACRHPNWSMGRKISVDSATMMNKGLEYIEARWLFNASASQIRGDDPMRLVGEKLIKENVAAMHATLDVNTEEKLLESVAMLRDARRIVLTGIGASGLVARNFGWKLTKIGYNAIVEQDMHALLATVQAMDPDDLLLAISYSGERREINMATDEALRVGGKILAITGFSPNALQQRATRCLYTIAEEQATRSAAISSTSAQMMLTDLLFMALVQQDLERAPERIRHSEELVKKLV